MPIQKRLGPALAGFRKGIGLSQAELAEKSGVSASLISSYELDKHVPTFSNLSRVLDALEVSLGDLAVALGDPPSKVDNGGDQTAENWRVVAMALIRRAVERGELSPDQVVRLVEKRKSAS